MSLLAKPVVGLIGMGEMGRMLAEKLAEGDRCRLLVCDLPERYEQLKGDYKDHANIQVLRNGHLVSRSADFILYCVETEYLEAVVEKYGPSTKVGAIVSTQASVKAPEQQAFEKYLPDDVKICSIHSLHGPSILPQGQVMIIIPFRCSTVEKEWVMKILSPLGSRYVELSYEEHDVLMANTQACTHAAFLSMGTAWAALGRFPWELGRYIGGIEVAKINITFRIYSSKWHVYAGLAILNPIAKVQIHQFARSATELFVLMTSNDEEGLRKRVYAGRDHVFGPPAAPKTVNSPIFLSDEMFSKFSIGEPESGPSPPNSHLTILAIVDCWRELGLNPLMQLKLAATPIFQLWFSLIYHLFHSPERLEKAIVAAVRNLDYRADDCEFVMAARGWSQCIGYGDFQLYRRRFEETSEFFKPRFQEVRAKGDAMIKHILQKIPNS
ncbi:hypothetical protein O181_035580 [Austropuccinia psidii MF-1]|uniref:Prephenate/arogenate dehydrogenase domain-containing protein n=1 Tax=Austropuccinia psidii MF-1 TaxID=1389203 RepID=A0A9Q3HBB2_9BASI|nr:hypothetical protein [Austropuccinia psidii MF-1]